MVSRNTVDIDIFFSLLRSGMYGIPVPESELPESIDWEAVVRLAKKHVVTGIIIESVQFLPERLRPSGDISAKMNGFALGLFRTNIILDSAVARLSSFLRQHGIEGVVLKGQGVARYYRMPQMRQSGDIDFYVGRRQFEKAIELCRKNLSDDRDVLSGDVMKCHAYDQHFGFDMDGIRIELHRLASKMFSPVLNRRFQNWVIEQLEHSSERRTVMIGRAEVTLPSYDFDAIFIFYHAWRHYIQGGIGLRQLCDWAMIFHSHASDIDTGRLKKTISRFGLTKAWKLFACVAVSRLGVSPDKMPLYDPAYLKKTEKVLEKIIDGGNFGYYSEANLRTRGYGLAGLRYGLNKVRNYTRFSISVFPVIPAEATFMFLNRLFFGTIDTVKRTVSKS